MTTGGVKRCRILFTLRSRRPTKIIIQHCDLHTRVLYTRSTVANQPLSGRRRYNNGDESVSIHGVLYDSFGRRFTLFPVYVRNGRKNKNRPSRNDVVDVRNVARPPGAPCFEIDESPDGFCAQTT